MSRRFGVPLLAGVAWLAAPGSAEAHALGQSFQLPVPLWLYLTAAGVAVAASFVVTLLVSGRTTRSKPFRLRLISERIAQPASVLLAVTGMVWWYGAIVIGFVSIDVAPLPAVLLWVGIWVGLPIAATLIGNAWPSFSPFRTTFGILEWLAARAGSTRLDAGLRYPPRLARWPAVLMLFAVAWAELIASNSERPATVATLMASYTLLTLLGMLLVGSVAWLRHAELFEVYLGWFGRIGSIGRQSVSAELCAGCDEACRAERCVDCPECSAAADHGERRPGLRPWFVGLMDVGRAGWSDAVLIVGALAVVTYDGLRETGAWLVPLGVLVDVFLPLLGPGRAFFAVETVGLLLVGMVFVAAFVAAVAISRRLAGPSAPPLGSSVGAYAATLLPIAGGYLLAHYLTLVVQGVIWLPTLLTDIALDRPTTLVAPPLDWIPISAVWYLSVGAIVLGHIAAVVLAHRLATGAGARRAEEQRRAGLTGLPLVALMVGYTVLSLWIIAQPIVIEPGATALHAASR